MDFYFNKHANFFITFHFKKSNAVNFKNSQLKKNASHALGPKFYPKMLPFVFPQNFMRIKGCYVILYSKTQYQSLNKRNREFGPSLEHRSLGNSCFLHGSIVSNIHMKCCLTVLHSWVTARFSSLSLEFIFSLGQLEPKSMTFQSLSRLHFSSKLFLGEYIQTVPSCNSFNMYFSPGPKLYVLSFNFRPHIWYIWLQIKIKNCM